MQENKKAPQAKDWHGEAFRLFGYKIMGANNHQQIADALRTISEILDDGGDLEIVVGRVGDMDEAFAAERSHVVTLKP